MRFLLNSFTIHILLIHLLLPNVNLWAWEIPPNTPTDSISKQHPWSEKNYVLQIWDNSNGLPQNAVFALEKDNAGFLWVATEEGLVRIDGEIAKVFDMDNYPQMLEQTYYTFYKTTSGIWASADRSIALLQKNIRTVIDCEEITKNTWIAALSEDAEGSLWIGTQAEEIHLWRDGTFKKLDYWNPDGNPRTQSFFPVGDSKMLVGTTKGLYEINYKTETVRMVSEADVSVYKIFGNGEDLYVSLLEDGIYKVSQDYGLELVIAYKNVKDLNPLSLTIDVAGRIWASSTEKGLILLENGLVSRFIYPELNNYSISRIYAEKDNVYLGTLGKGLAIVKPVTVKQTEYTELKGKNIKPIFQNHDSTFWIGTQANGVYRLKNGDIKEITAKEGLRQNGVLSIGGANGKIYVGSTSGISVLHADTGKILGKITQEEGLASNYVYALFKDSKNWLWILTRYGGLHYLDEDEQLHRIDLPYEYANTNFTTITELPTDEILIGSISDGLFWLENGMFKENKPLPLNPGENIIYSLYMDEEKDLWIGTHGGIVLYSNGKFKSLKKANGLKSQGVFSITCDGQNGIWISNNFGVQNIRQSELKRFKDNDGEDFFASTILYNESFGMPNSETNGLIFPSAMRDFSGSIWFPTVEGLAVINPDETIWNDNTINFQWDEVSTGITKTPIDGRITIPAGTNMFTISFSNVNFENPNQYMLFYRIANENNAWLPIKDQRTLNFNGLKMGNHLLEVKVMGFGHENSIQALEIEVKGFFFETLGFKILMAILFLLLIYFVVKFYLNSKMKKELENLVTSRTAELSNTNEKLQDAFSEIETQNATLKEITWDQSHMVRAPLTKALGINQLLINYDRYSEVKKSKEQLEEELLATLNQLDHIVRNIHNKSENLAED